MFITNNVGHDLVFQENYESRMAMNSFEPNKPHNKSLKKNICDVIIFFVVVNCSCVLCVAKHLDNMSN